MKQIFSVLLGTMLLAMLCLKSKSQVMVTNRTNVTPALSSSYSTLASAISALNSITAISGPVILTLTPGMTEVAPPGGYSINFTAATSAANNVIIDGSKVHDSIIASNSLTSGSLNDAIFKIVGSDYVTIKRFTMVENPSNTTTALATNNMTEWGVALLRRNSSTTDGAQYNTIIDNSISLDRTYPNSFGIYSNVRHSPTAVSTASDITNVSGSNLGNQVYNNRISNVNMGIAFIGCNIDGRMDDSNDIGGAYSFTGNIINDWGSNSLVTGNFAGNTTTEYYGILMRNQKNSNVSRNTIIGSTSLSGTTATPIRGIHVGTITGTVTGSFTTTIANNTVTITDNLPNGTSSMARLDGIYCSEKLSILSISNNLITGLAVTTTNANHYIRGISNAASATAVYINGNSIEGNTTTATTMGGWFFGIDQTGNISGTLEINNNLIGDKTTALPAITYSGTAHSSTMVRGINHDPSGNPGGTASISVNGNSFYGFVQANSPSNRHIYISCDHTTTTNSNIHIDGNHFENITANTSGDVNFIKTTGTMATNAGATLSVSNNEIVSSFSKSLGGGDVYLYNAAGSSGTGNTMTESGNKFSNISLTGITVMHGWYNNEGLTAAGPQKSITGNIFTNWACGGSSAIATNAIYCNWASGSSKISGNSISNITAPGDLNGILSAVTTATSQSVSGNKISSLQTTSSGKEVTGLRLRGGNPNTEIHQNEMEFVQSSPATGTYTGIFPDFIGGHGDNILINYNTVYMALSSPSAPIQSYALRLESTTMSDPADTRAYVRNNILVNPPCSKNNYFSSFSRLI